MTPEVETAIEEIRQAFPGHSVEVSPEQQGGAYVIVNNLELGEQYKPTASWVGFLITFQYPYADVYPHFIDGNIRRASDGSSQFGAGFSGPTQWQGGRLAFQISRRSNRWNASQDTAATKLAKVLDWIRTQ